MAFTIPPEFSSSSVLMILDTDLLAGSSLRFVPNSPTNEQIDYFNGSLKFNIGLFPSSLQSGDRFSIIKSFPDRALMIKIRLLSLFEAGR